MLSKQLLSDIASAVEMLKADYHWRMYLKISGQAEKTLDIQGRKVRITSENQSDSYPDHPGIPGKQGGSIPKGPARGENVPCRGFERKSHLKWHYREHGDEFPGLTMEQYEQQARDFIAQPCSDTVDGYITDGGVICRFNRSTGEFGKGVPGGNIITYYKVRYNRKTGASDLAAANRYFERVKSEEAISDDETA